MRKFSFKELMEIYKEVKCESEESPEIAVCFGIIIIVLLIFAGIKGCF